jgi:hypothetical protein
MKAIEAFRNAGQALAAVLALSCASHGQTLNTIYSFGHNDLGRLPTAGVIVGAHGELFGTIQIRRERSGAESDGVAYELVPPASPGGEWAEIVLHNFGNQNGADSPGGTLLAGPSGALYGVTGSGSGGGTVFQLRPPAGAGTHWGENVLHTFGSNGDGANPSGALVFGPGKALYGTTEGGGAISGKDGGTVYLLSPPAQKDGAWEEKILYSFPGYQGDGAQPESGLTPGGDGTLYGTTVAGGNYVGTVFQLTPPSSQGSPWSETVLHVFDLQPGDPGLPNGVIVGRSGVLYGTAMEEANPKHCTNGCGTVFQLTPPAEQGGTWTETILHAFAGNPAGDGSQPNSLVLAPSGALYGTTWTGGLPGEGSFGTIFEMVPPSSPGGDWTEVVLYRFTGGADGSAPNAVTLGPDGNLYGTTFIGGVSKDGTRNQGTVFQFVLQ